MKETYDLLILGGNGFVGRNIIKRALELDWKVLNISLSTAHKFLSPNVDNLHINLTDRYALEKDLKNKRFIYVVNASGYVDHSSYFDKGYEIITEHYFGLMNLIASIDKSALQKFINLGSSDEYGDNDSPQNEEMKENPFTPYSLAKLNSSKLLMMLNKTENFPSVVARLFLVYGPDQSENRLIPHVIEQCMLDKSFSVSSGHQIRDFCYIDDVIDAIFLILFNDKVKGEIINIASGKPTFVRDVILQVQKIINKGNPEFGKKPLRKGENPSLFANINKSHKLLKWRPKINLKEGLEKVIECKKDQA